MSLFAQYIQELTGKHIIEDEKGFATYFFIENGVYIEDIFVHPDHRKSNKAADMADKIAKIAKDKGFSKMYGTVRPTNTNATASLKVLLAYGFKILEAGPNAIAMVKDI